MALVDVFAVRKRINLIDELIETVDRFPAFQPHRLLRNGHLQTVLGNVFRRNLIPYCALQHRVELSGGDSLILHEDRPSGWQYSSPVAILVHGLTGCHQSAYMVHAAKRLNEAGVRTFRMDMRGCGAGEGLSSMPYHAGCSEDLLIALRQVASMCPMSPISLIGFSIGGNVALKLAGESADRLPPQLSRLVVVSPPIDLEACVERISRVAARFYDRYFASAHYRQLRRSALLSGHASRAFKKVRPQGQRDFDDWYTSAVWGFDTVDQFYSDTSSRHTISNVRVPTLLIASRDDPLVPVELFDPLERHPAITLCLTDHGGHLGFIGRKGIDADRHWLDWRIVEYVAVKRYATQLAAA